MRGFNKDYSKSVLESSTEEVKRKLATKCDCLKDSCFKGLDPEMVYRHRLNIAELTRTEHDFYLMGIVRAVSINVSEVGTKRQRKRSAYTYMGKKVCLYAFLYLENTPLYQLKKIRSHVEKHGVTAIQHGNLHKVPHNALPLALYKRVNSFLQKYLKVDKQHSNKTITLNQSMTSIYKEYRDHERDQEDNCDGKPMGYTTFRNFFRKQFPHVRLNPLPRYLPSNHITGVQIIEVEVEHDDDVICEQVDEPVCDDIELGEYVCDPPDDPDCLKTADFKYGETEEMISTNHDEPICNKTEDANCTDDLIDYDPEDDVCLATHLVSDEREALIE